MYRVFWFVGPLLALGLIVSIVAAFHWGGDGWGHHTETVQIIGNGGTDSAGHTIDVVRVDPGDHRHWGFFPFALLGPLFVLFIFFAIFRGLFFRGRWHHRYEFAHDAWHRRDGGPSSFEDWHRRQHESGPPSPTNVGEKPSHPSDS